jgi:hypothetical protein
MPLAKHRRIRENNIKIYNKVIKGSFSSDAKSLSDGQEISDLFMEPEV